jgi:hypothetical protein
MARERRGSEDRDPAAADRMTALERNSRRLLRVYPAAYRRERGDEIIGTLLEATPGGRAWPRLRDARALVVCGLQTRAAQNRQYTTMANLRIAVMVGLSLYLAMWAAIVATRVIISVVHGYGPGFGFGLYPGWQFAVWSVLSAATVVLAWTAPRLSVLTAALAVVAGVAYYEALHVSAVVPAVLDVLYLVALVTLAIRGARPSLRWLWLIVVIVAVSPVIGIIAASGWFGLPILSLIPNAVLVAVAVVALLVIAIDARLMLALLTYVVASTAQSLSVFLQSGVGALNLLPYLLGLAAVTLPVIWLLRRQSARSAASSGPPEPRR